MSSIVHFWLQQYTGHTWSLLARIGLPLHTTIYSNATAVSCLSLSTLSPPSFPPPSTLLIGYSVVTNVREKSAATFCFLSCDLTDIIDIYKRLWASWPISHYLRMLSFKLGALLFPADIHKYQKWNLTKLLDSLTAQSKQLFVSGPLPPLTHLHTQFPRQATVHLCYLQQRLVSIPVYSGNTQLCFAWKTFTHMGKDKAIYTGEELVYDYGDPNCPGNMYAYVYFYLHILFLWHTKFHHLTKL